MPVKKEPKKRAEKYEEKLSFKGDFNEFLDIAIGKSVEVKPKAKAPKKSK
jgi:hypothetical protein